MKKKLFYKLVFLLALISVLSCKLNIDSQNKKHAITITIEEPNSSYTAVQTRSAIPEFPDNSIKFKLIATQDSTTIVSNSPIQENSNKFLLEITEGTWRISVYGFESDTPIAELKESDAIFYGQKEIYVTDNGEYSATIPVYYIQNGTGNVHLQINVNETNISKLTIGGTSSNLDTNFYRDENGIITIEATDVPASTYNAVLSFYENIGTRENPEFVKVISLQEKINVRQNLITNQWIKAGNTLYLQAANGIYAEFILTKEIIAAIENTSFYVSSNNVTENKLENSLISPDDSNSGSWADPFASIQGAVNRISVLASASNNQLPYTIYIDGPLTNQSCSIKNSLEEILNLTILPYKTVAGETSASIKGTVNKPVFSICNNVCMEIIDLQIDDGDIEVSSLGKLILTGNPKLTNGNLKLSDDTVLSVKEITRSDGDEGENDTDIIAKIIVENPVENKIVIQAFGEAILSENVLGQFRLNNPGYYLTYSEDKMGIVKASSVTIKLPEPTESNVIITAIKNDGSEIQPVNNCFSIYQDLLANPMITAGNTVFYVKVQLPQKDNNVVQEFVPCENIELTLYLENIPIVTANSSDTEESCKILTIPANFCFPGKYLLQVKYNYESLLYDSKYLIQIL